MLKILVDGSDPDVSGFFFWYVAYLILPIQTSLSEIEHLFHTEAIQKDGKPE
jgi:hypothetical protein